MLYLGDGPRTVMLDERRSIHLYPDYTDPRRFYYAPAAPHLATNPDGSPALRLLLLREDLREHAGDDDVTGLLMLDVDLSWPAEDLERAARRLQVDAQLADLPILQPLDYRRGSVRFLLLDQITPEPDEEEEPKPTQFVVRTLQVAHPSLYGDNRAIFQAQLTKKGAALIAGSLDGMLPIGVVYELGFAGLSPAYKIRATVDWDKVHTHFSERFSLNLLFYHHDAAKAIDQLIDERAIVIDVTVEGIGEEAMDADRELAQNAVRQLIFEQFFTATFKPMERVGDSTGEAVADAVGGVVRALAFGGTWGGGYQRKDVKIEELRNLSVDWTARRAVERTIYPQAHLHTILGEGGVADTQSFVTEVDLADFHPDVALDIVANAAWAADGIFAITVDIEYDDADSGEVRQATFQLDATRPRAQMRERADRANGARFRYRYTVDFGADDVPGPAGRLDSGPMRPHDSFVLTIDPRELFRSMHLEIATVKGFPFEAWPTVHGFLRHRSHEGWEIVRDGLLRDGQATFPMRFRTHASGGTDEVRLRYLHARGRIVETPWAPMSGAFHAVTDPEPSELRVTAVVAGDRKKIANLLVDLEYEDPENGVFESALLAFEQEKIAQPLTWRVRLADPTRRRYRYRMTMVTTDGDFVQSGWIGTDAPTLPVGEVYVRTLTVEVVTGALHDSVASIVVEVSYADEANGVSASERFELGADARAEWKVPLKDAARRAWSRTVTWRLRSGFDITEGPTSTTSTFLAIPGTPPEQ